jgi:hypothetical protein
MLSLPMANDLQLRDVQAVAGCILDGGLRAAA